MIVTPVASDKHVFYSALLFSTLSQTLTLFLAGPPESGGEHVDLVPLTDISPTGPVHKMPFAGSDFRLVVTLIRESHYLTAVQDRGIKNLI